MIDGQAHGTLWTNTTTDLGANTLATAINDGDVVVGYTLNPDSTVSAFTWSDSAGLQLIAFPQGYINAVPTSINKEGMVVGFVSVLASNPNRHDISTTLAWAWTNASGVVFLPSLITASGVAGLNITGVSVREGQSLATVIGGQ